MEKIDLQTFRNLKKEISDICQKQENEFERMTIEERDEIFAKYKKIIETLLEYDLSDIDFEEWRGIHLSQDIQLDFSKTNANLDFSIIDGWWNNLKPNFKNCQIRNFDFEKYYYSPEMFDEKFIQENSIWFLSEEVPKSVREHYYQKKLYLQEFSKNLQYFKGKKIAHSFRYGDGSRIADLYGEDIYQLFVDYKPLMDIISSDYRTILSTKILKKPITDEQRKRIMGSVIGEYARTYGWGSFQNWDNFKMIMDFIPIEDLPLQPVNKQFIKKYGLDNIIALDKETNGLFSHRIYESNTYFLRILASEEQRNPKLVNDESLTYEQFRDIMYEILLNVINDPRNKEDHRFIHGKFREEHPEIFIDGNLTEEIEDAFYKRQMTAEMVRENPELIQLLQGKYLNMVFSQDMTIGYKAYKDDEGNVFRKVPINVNMAQYLSEKLGQEEFLKICADYGKCLDNVKISIISDEITIESVRETIEQAIYNKIEENGMEYFEELPLSFREKHPELFLPKEIDEDIRKRFCEGNLTYSDIRKNPQIKELLLTKNISAGFNKLKYDQNFRTINPIWEKLSEQEIMDLAEEFGDYLKDIDANIFYEGQSDEDRIKAVQDNIEQNILHHRSPLNPGAPSFFKQKHPDMFLSDDAPDDLKEAFYDDSVEFHGTIIHGSALNFQQIKKHPEWRKFLQGKNLSRAFNLNYIELFKRFDSATLLKLGMKNPETIEKMVETHNEEVLEKWYKSTGGKFVPHHVVMLNFPENEIDSFLSNSKRWSQLMKIDRYNLDDDGKTDILKAAYTMGVFQGDDYGFNKIMKLFTDIPQELTKEEYEQVIHMLDIFNIGYNNGNSHFEQKHNELNMFKHTYILNDDGKYILSIDKQKNKDDVKIVRKLLEDANIPRILTPMKSHQIFDSFSMEYNPDFMRFFYDNIEEILSNSEYIKDIAAIQRQFKEIVTTNAGRRLTLDIAQDYIKSISYTNIEVGNEEVAEQAQIAGYSQKDFEQIQRLFNEGEMREFSSIPRIQGTTRGYTYEILRLDDPLALTIGTLTDCCQEIHGAGKTSMEHSVVSPDGRVFCVRDEKGRLVAQSWFWRNQYTGCFDNIEIPNKIFELYQKEHPDIGRKGLTRDVLEVYKKAAQDLMQEDKKIYQELLENGTITQEQYDSLLLGKVTIGLGYNDIAAAIQTDKTIHMETEHVGVRSTERLPDLYTDAGMQYTIAERDGIVRSKNKNLYVHQDDVPVFDGTNMSNTVLLTMGKMEQTTRKYNLSYLRERDDEKDLPKSQRIINSIARKYELNPDDTKVMATKRIAIIYSKNREGKIKIAELLSSPLKKGLTEEQKQKATTHIMHQIKKALKQIGVQDSKIDISSLDEEQKQVIESVIQEIEEEQIEK